MLFRSGLTRIVMARQRRLLGNRCALQPIWVFPAAYGLSATARRLTVRWAREIWKGVHVVVDPWIVQAVFLVAGAEPAKLARWMGENVATTTMLVSPVEPQDTTRTRQPLAQLQGRLFSEQPGPPCTYQAEIGT